MALVVTAALFGCGPTFTTYDSSGMTDGPPLGKLSEGVPGGSDDEASGDDSGDGGPVIDGDTVDCATLPAGGETVAGGELTALGFPEYRCNPRTDGAGLGAEYQCCSVDPAAEAGALPNYADKGIGGGGMPYFSGINNDNGVWGMCVRTTDTPPGSGLVENEADGCPIPCNPLWSAGARDVVCGPSRVCCQTHELQPADCLLDVSTGLWRPVNGNDIGISSDWNAAAHATHQDPSGPGCTAVVGGDQSSPLFVDCVRQLSVADQRGVCMALSPGQACPDAQPSYVDACEAMNL